MLVSLGNDPPAGQHRTVTANFSTTLGLNIFFRYNEELGVMHGFSPPGSPIT